MKNPVAKNLHKFNKPAIMLSKRRKQLGSTLAWKDDYLALDTCFMQEEGHTQSNDEVIDELDALEED